jgi:V/A-type H+-transporting ATPase subunit K
MKSMKRVLIAGAAVGMVVMLVLALAVGNIWAQEGKTAAAEKRVMSPLEFLSLAFGAAVAAGLGFIGGGIAVGQVGAAAMGAAAERPELLVKSLVFVALGEGIAIFGLVVAMLMLLRLPT